MAIFNKIDSALAWRILTKSIRPWHGDFCKQGLGPIGPKGQGGLAMGPIRPRGLGPKGPIHRTFKEPRGRGAGHRPHRAQKPRAQGTGGAGQGAHKAQGPRA